MKLVYLCLSGSTWTAAGAGSDTSKLAPALAAVKPSKIETKRKKNIKNGKHTKKINNKKQKKLHKKAKDCLNVIKLNLF